MGNSCLRDFNPKIKYDNEKRQIQDKVASRGSLTFTHINCPASELANSTAPSLTYTRILFHMDKSYGRLVAILFTINKVICFRFLLISHTFLFSVINVHHHHHHRDQNQAHVVKPFVLLLFIKDLDFMALKYLKKISIGKNLFFLTTKRH